MRKAHHSSAWALVWLAATVPHATAAPVTPPLPSPAPAASTQTATVDRPRVLAVEGANLFIDTNAQQGARVGQSVVLFRPVRVVDPDTGLQMEDFFAYGTSTIEEVGDVLVRARVPPDTLARIQLGDVVGLPRADPQVVVAAEPKQSELQPLLEALDACSAGPQVAQIACWTSFAERAEEPRIQGVARRQAAMVEQAIAAAPPAAPAEPVPFLYSAPDRVRRGAPINIYITLPEEAEVESAMLYTRREADRGFTQTPMRRDGSRGYRVEVPTGASTRGALDWYVELTSQAGLVSRQPSSPARVQVNPPHTTPGDAGRTRLRLDVEGLAWGDSGRSSGSLRRIEGAVELGVSRPLHSVTLGAGDLAGSATVFAVGDDAVETEARMGLNSTYAFLDLAVQMGESTRLSVRPALGVSSEGPTTALGLAVWRGREGRVYGRLSVNAQFEDLLDRDWAEIWDAALGELEVEGGLQARPKLTLSGGLAITLLPSGEVVAPRLRAYPSEEAAAKTPRLIPLDPLFQPNLSLGYQASPALRLTMRGSGALQTATSRGGGGLLGVEWRW